MDNLATLPMWLIAIEQHHGSLRSACEAYGMDPGYWHRLKTGEKCNPSADVLERLGLREATTLYARKE